MVIAFCFALMLGGCASESKPKHRAERKWYQGTMDSDERTFFVDTFFNGR